MSAPEELSIGFVVECGEFAVGPRRNRWDELLGAWLDAHGEFTTPERIEALSCHLAESQVEGLVAVEGLCGSYKDTAGEARARYRLEVDEWFRCPLCQRGKRGEQ